MGNKNNNKKQKKSKTINTKEKIRISIVGTRNLIGKKNIVQAMVGKAFNPDITPFTQEFQEKKDYIIEEKECLILVQYIPCSGIYRESYRIYCKFSQIIIFVYDITNKESFDELYNIINNCLQLFGNNFIGGIIGNKMDLYDKKQVDENMGRELASKYSFNLKLLSVKENQKDCIDFLKELVIEYFISKNKNEKKIEKIIKNPPIIKKEIKIFLTGGVAVGKKTLAYTFLNNKYEPNQNSYAAVEGVQKELIFDGINYLINLFYSPGNELNRHWEISWLKKENIIIFVYNVKDYESFKLLKYLIKMYYDLEIKDYIGGIIGAKYDEIERIKVKDEDARELAKENNFKLKLLSVKENPESITDFIKELVKYYFQIKKE